MQDLIGKTFGRWTIIDKGENNDSNSAAKRRWLCRCSCSNHTEKEVIERSLFRGTSISCGCSRSKPTKKLIDLSGKKFGRWTVKRRAEKRGQTSYWFCVCDCDPEKEHEIEGGSLRHGKSISCGCYRKEEAIDRLKGKPSGQMEDLTGNIYGAWTVLSLGERKSADYGLRIMWKCKCECGTEKNVEGTTLKGGHSKSCGCINPFNDLTGKTFGRLTAISQAGRTKTGHISWNCNCVCGGTKIVSSHNLVRGFVASCGCAKIEGVIVRPEHVRKHKNEYTIKKYREDVKFNINRRMSSMVWAALRRENTEKGGSWTESVGYTVHELQERLEQTMPEGYNWDNYLSGILEIDHIIPLNEFDYKGETDESFKQAWALSNLRLLCGDDNRIKNNRVVSVGEFDNSWFGMINGKIVTSFFDTPNEAFEIADLSARTKI